MIQCKSFRYFRFFVIVSTVILQFAAYTSDSSAQQSSVPMAGYPIDPKVVTTIESTVIPVPVPSNSPKLLPNDVSKYSQYGYGVWKPGAGLKAQKRLDIMAPSYTGTSVTKASNILRFFTDLRCQ